MILAKAIQQKANETKLRDIQIEKDYILTWVLWGISQQPEIKQLLVFKGGTTLKKIYFQDYRYSEDLDFTLLKDDVSDEHILHYFNKAFELIMKKTNIPLSIIKSHIHNTGSINFQISYKGPLGGQKNIKQLKVDITRGEKIIFNPIEKSVFIDYQDLTPFSLLCYPLEEILIEKMCALIGRTEPRDLYDLWYLLKIAQLNIMDYWLEYTYKAKHKKHEPSQFTTQLEDKLTSFKTRWEISLSNQIYFLPPFDQITREIGKHIRKIKKATNK